MRKYSSKISFALLICFVAFLFQACNGSITSIEQSPLVTASATPFSQMFAAGTKGVKIFLNTNVTGSFAAPSVTPSPMPIPSTYPGYDGVSTFNPGISASTYYALDGVTAITQPSWLLDFELGFTAVPGNTGCATFGSTTSSLDVANTFRTSEIDCDSSTPANTGVGTGASTDPVFLRIILNRSNTVLGSAENLMVQIEYQASGLHFNSDGTSLTNPEYNLDQLWKVFWNTSLVSSATPNPFAVFVPPNYAACTSNGTGSVGAPGNCADASYKGSPVKVRQFIIPLSAYPTLSVIQISRLSGRINNLPGSTNYVSSYCTSSNSPLCLGVVIESVTLMRF